MWNWITAHQLVVGIVLMWLASNAIGAMPTPHDGSSAVYEWFFKFAQAIGGALARLMAIYSPNTLSALTGHNTENYDSAASDTRMGRQTLPREFHSRLASKWGKMRSNDGGKR
jgi:hypothetical protein